jgi:hypothetical protein
MAMPYFIFILPLLHFFSMADQRDEFCPSRGMEQFTAPCSTPWGGQKSYCAGFCPSSGMENVPDFVHLVGWTVKVTVKSLVKKHTLVSDHNNHHMQVLQ